MKNKLFILFIILFLICILCFPRLALEGSVTGLLLWFHTILPTLLPFIILTSILLKLDYILKLTRFFHPVTGRIFHINPYASYALICGLLCGYPMGAKIISQLLQANKISAREGQYLLGVCNNVSPAFFINYVLIQTLNLPKYAPLFTFVLYAVILIYAFITRPPKTSNTQCPKTVQNKTMSFNILDESIMDGFETITRLGGYIILFAIIAKMATAITKTATIFGTFIIGIIELTNGNLALSELTLPPKYAVPIAFFICIFGGICGIAQTNSMIWQTSLSIKKYIKTKLILSLISMPIVYIICILLGI